MICVLQEVRESDLVWCLLAVGSLNELQQFLVVLGSLPCPGLFPHINISGRESLLF